MVYTPNIFYVNLSSYICQLVNLQESPKRVEEILKKLRSSRGSDKFEEWEVTPSKLPFFYLVEKKDRGSVLGR